MRICSGFASSHSREATLETVPIKGRSPAKVAYQRSIESANAQRPPVLRLELPINSRILITGFLSTYPTGGSNDRADRITEIIRSLNPDFRRATFFTAIGVGPIHATRAEAGRQGKILLCGHFTGGFDPVAVGFVASLARPGGNLTGVTSLAIELAPKRLELLQELVPTATSIASTSATHLSSAPPWLNSARGSLKRGRPSLRPRIAIAMAAMGRAHHGWSMPPTVWSGSSRRR